MPVSFSRGWGSFRVEGKQAGLQVAPGEMLSLFSMSGLWTELWVNSGKLRLGSWLAPSELEEL